MIDTSAVESAITDGQGDMKAIGGYIVGALVIPGRCWPDLQHVAQGVTGALVGVVGAFFAGAFITGYRTGEFF